MNTYLGNVQSTGLIVSSAMFGGNDLFLSNLLSAENATFSAAADLLNLTGLRFPGGSMTEDFFDVTNPNGPPLGESSGIPYVGISEFLTYSRSVGRAATVVLPTQKMYSGELDADSATPRQIQVDYLDSVLQYVRNLVRSGDSGSDALPDTPIAALEIGNEYWGRGQMSATEYGRLVNEIVPKIIEIFREELGDQALYPKILVQMGSPWDAQYSEGIYSHLSWPQRIYQCNRDIISEITNPEAKAYISGLIEHYYYDGENETLDQGPSSTRYISSDLKIWEDAGYGDLDLVLTEWGVYYKNPSQFGLRGASVIIEQMERMVAMGADAAFAWPVQGWNTSLAGSPNTEPELTPMGAAFQLMSKSVVGLDLLNIEGSGSDVEIDGFGSDDRIVLFIMSRSTLDQAIDYDISELAGDFVLSSGTKIGIDPIFSTSDPNAAAILSNYSEGELGAVSSLNFTLHPFEVMRIVLENPDGKLEFGTSQNDSLLGRIGDDRLFGMGGSDSIAGNRGGDHIYGGSGSDRLDGWGGNDAIFGGLGSDSIYGLEDHDTLFGGFGDDILRGATGNDSIFGGEGQDKIRGGGGNDTIFGDLGFDLLAGGLGKDTFVFQNYGASTELADKVYDFEPGIDTISLNHKVFYGLEVGALQNERFALSVNGSAGDLADRLIYNYDDGSLWFDQDGSGSRFQPMVFAILEAGLNIGARDFTIF